MIDKKKFWSIWHKLEPWFAYALISCSFLGIAPLNVALMIGSVFLVVHLIFDQPSWDNTNKNTPIVQEFSSTPPLKPTIQHPKQSVHAPLWFWGVMIYLLSRAIISLASPELAMSLGHFLKDWRLIALLWGATGILSQQRWGWLLVLAAVLVNLGYGLFQLTYKLGWWPNWQVTFKNHYRITRIPTFFKQVLTLSGVASLGMFIPQVLDWPRVRALMLWIVVGLILVLSGSRGPLLATIFALLIWLFLSGIAFKKIFLFVLLTAIVGSGVWLLQGKQNRLYQVFTKQWATKSWLPTERLPIWQTAWELGKAHPLKGIGPGRFHEVTKNYRNKGVHSHAHNVFLQAWVDGGVIGLIGMIALYGGFFGSIWRLGRKKAAAIFGLLIAMSVAGLSELNLYDGEIAILFFMLLGHGFWATGSGIIWQPKTKGYIDVV